MHFSQMMMYFQNAMEKNNCNQEAQEELMALLNGYQEMVCVKVYDEGEALGSIEEVQGSNLFKTVI